MAKNFFIGFILSGLLGACTEYTPKPRGYMRLEPSKARYVALSVAGLPYTFCISDQVVIELPEEGQPGWINVDYKELNAKIYCSYSHISKDNLPEFTAEAQKFAERITGQIQASAYEDTSSHIHGMLFDLGGNVASPIQFYLTDSVSRFFRGALYYNTIPNADSLSPMTSYLRKDIIELIQTFNWKE